MGLKVGAMLLEFTFRWQPAIGKSTEEADFRKYEERTVQKP